VKNVPFLFLTHEVIVIVVVVLKGDITQKGYEKKRQKILGPYLSISNGSQSAPAAGKRVFILFWRIFESVLVKDFS
jgi:hypothetical protein